MKPSNQSHANTSKLNSKSSKSMSFKSKQITEIKNSNSELALNFPNNSSADIILGKTSNSKSNFAEHRQKEKALQLQEISQAPHLRTSKKRVRSLEILQTELDSSQTNKNLEKTKKKQSESLKNQKSPKSNSLIGPPDLSTLKEIISKIPEKPVVTNIKLSELNIVQKTELLMKKKEENLIKSKNLKIETDLEPCTFKPDIKKPKSARAKSESIISPKVNTFNKTPKTSQDPLLRIPVPTKSVQFPQNPQPNQHIFLSTHYSQFSPIIKTYSFKEGANIEELKNRSQQMMTYYIHTNRT